MKIYDCPICGKTITENDSDIITIKTKRRSTVLVHMACYQSQTRKEKTK